MKKNKNTYKKDGINHLLLFSIRKAISYDNREAIREIYGSLKKILIEDIVQSDSNSFDRDIYLLHFALKEAENETQLLNIMDSYNLRLINDILIHLFNLRFKRDIGILKYYRSVDNLYTLLLRNKIKRNTNNLIVNFSELFNLNEDPILFPELEFEYEFFNTKKTFITSFALINNLALHSWLCHLFRFDLIDSEAFNNYSSIVKVRHLDYRMLLNILETVPGDISLNWNLWDNRTSVDLYEWIIYGITLQLVCYDCRQLNLVNYHITLKSFMDDIISNCQEIIRNISKWVPILERLVIINITSNRIDLTIGEKMKEKEKVIINNCNNIIEYLININI